MKSWLAVILSILPSCAFLPRSTPVPVKLLEGGNSAGSELVVFLPGRWSLPEEFRREGFFDIAARQWPDARLVAPDLHLGYFKSRSIARRLHEDLILPARRSGVKRVRLVGVSMGGLAALIYDAEYPGQVDEIILLSPYLGEEPVLREIEAAGSLARWQPGPVAAPDFSRKLWVGLREERSRPRILLGCGTEDRLAASSRIFAREFTTQSEQEWLPGGHDWQTWRKLFEALLAK